MGPEPPSQRTCPARLMPQTFEILKWQNNLWTRPEKTCVPKKCLQDKEADIMTTGLMLLAWKLKTLFRVGITMWHHLQQ